MEKFVIKGKYNIDKDLSEELIEYLCKRFKLTEDPTLDNGLHEVYINIDTGYHIIKSKRTSKFKLKDEEKKTILEYKSSDRILVGDEDDVILRFRGV